MEELTIPGKGLEKILLVKPSALGDVIHALPVVQALKEAYPQASLSWLIKDKLAEVLKGNPWVDEIIPWKRSSFLALIRRMRRREFDLAIDLQGLFRSGLLTLLSNAPLRLGFNRENTREKAYIFYNLWVNPSERIKHVVEKNLSLLRGIGIDSQESPRFFIPSGEEEEKYISRFIASIRKPIIGLNPGAGWPTKRWPVQNFALLGDKIIREGGGEVLLIWGPGEKERVEEIKRRMEEKALLAPPTSIIQLAALLKKCFLLVSGDTGPLHLAATLSLPVVALYGPSDPERNGPYTEKKVVIWKKLNCSPCWRKECREPICLQSITVDEVFSAVKKLLARK